MELGTQMSIDRKPERDAVLTEHITCACKILKTLQVNEESRATLLAAVRELHTALDVLKINITPPRQERHQLLDVFGGIQA
jgi:hypothetical protein